MSTAPVPRGSLAAFLCLPFLAAQAPAPKRDRPDLRREWLLKYHGGPATASYLDYKARKAEEEVRRNARLFARAAGAAVPAWREIGPNAGRTGSPLISEQVNDSGRSTAILTHPKDPRIVYVAYAGGGVWKSENAQLDATGDWTWRSITDALPASSGSGNIAAGALAMHPDLPETLYLGLGDAFDSEGRGLYISTDGGGTWSLGGSLGSSTRTLAILPSQGTLIHVGTNKGLFRSEDGGRSFAAVTLPGLGEAKVWSIEAFGPSDLVCAAESGSGGSLWTSSDGGKTWTKATLDAKASGINPLRISLGRSASSADQVWGTCQSGESVAQGLLKSTDKGRTWTFVANPEVLSDANGQGFYNLAIAADPNDSNKVFIGADNSVWRTLDGGATWARMTDAYHRDYQYAHADVHCTAWSRNGSRALFFGTDGGFTIFRDPFRAVIPKGSGVPVPDRTFADSRRNVGISTQLIYNLGCSLGATPSDTRYRIVTGHQDNGSRVRVGSGSALDASTAFDETGPTGDGFAALVHPKNGEWMLTASYQNRFIRSVEGGKEGSWKGATTGLSGGGPFKSVLVLGLADPTGNTVLTHDGSAVYKSTNFAESWTALPMSGFSGSINHVNAAPGDAQAVAVVGDGGAVTYNGSNWTPFASFGAGFTANYVAFDPKDARTIYAASTANRADAPHLVRSQNAGQSWQPLDADGSGFPKGIPVHVVQAAPWDGRELYAGTDFGVYRSLDGGGKWERYGQGLPLVSTRDIYLAPDRSFIRVATFGRGVWELQPSAVVGVSVTVNPATATVKVGVTQTFTASVAGSANTAVTWSVQEAGGGTVSASGLYTAPATPGTYHVVATSAADPTRSATATVTVVSTDPPKSLDLNKDGVVDQRDLLALAQQFGTKSSDADLNGDGLVNDADLTLLLNGI